MVDTGTEHVDGDYRREVRGDHVHYVGDDSCRSFWAGPGAHHRPHSYPYWDKAHHGYGT